MSRVPTLVILLSAAAACGRATSPADPDATPGVDAEAGGPDAAVPDWSRVYAHSGQDLYRIDTTDLEVILVGPFGSALGASSITDIAIDKDDRMIGVSLSAIFEIDESTGTATHLADFTGVDGFTSLSFVPVDPDDPGSAEDLIAANDQGAVFRIDPATGVATEIGSYGTFQGETIRSSGDIVSIHGFGTVATVTTVGALGPDVLARLEVGTFAATPIGSGTGYNDLWGIGFWAGDVFGFSEDGSFVLIDTSTGVATPVETSVPRWWGAAVTTAAPIVD